MASPKVLASDAKWKAEMDADTLAQAAAIRSDSARMKKAKVAAKGMAAEQQTKASALKRVAKAKIPKGRKK